MYFRITAVLVRNRHSKWHHVAVPGSKDTQTFDVSATLCSTIDNGLQLTGGFQSGELSTLGLAVVGTATIAAPTTQPAKFQLKLKGKALKEPPPLP